MATPPYLFSHSRLFEPSFGFRNNKGSKTLVDWSVLSVNLGFPFQQTSTERRVEVACPKAAQNTHFAFEAPLFVLHTLDRPSSRSFFNNNGRRHTRN